VKTSTRVATL